MITKYNAYDVQAASKTNPATRYVRVTDYATIEAERDEWKRRCYAIVAMLARGYTAHLREVHANALNIAEGRDNG